jgi:hypothetical protein
MLCEYVVVDMDLEREREKEYYNFIFIISLLSNSSFSKYSFHRQVVDDEFNLKEPKKKKSVCI